MHLFWWLLDFKIEMFSFKILRPSDFNYWLGKVSSISDCLFLPVLIFINLIFLALNLSLAMNSFLWWENGVWRHFTDLTQNWVWICKWGIMIDHAQRMFDFFCLNLDILVLNWCFIVANLRIIHVWRTSWLHLTFCGWLFCKFIYRFIWLFFFFSFKCFIQFNHFLLQVFQSQLQLFVLAH